MISEPTGPSRGVSTMAFSPDGSHLATVDQTRPGIVWIWTLGTTPKLLSALIHEHPVKQIVWHPSKTALLLTTVNATVATARYWTPHNPPVVARVPVSPSETGRYDVRWLVLGHGDDMRFWFGTPEDYVLGHIENAGSGISQFRVLYSVHNKVPAGSHSTSMGR